MQKDNIDAQLKKMQRDIQQLKEKMDHVATKNDISGFATKNDISGFATKNDISGFATKNDIIEFKDAILKEIKDMRDEVAIVTGYKDQIEDHDIRIETIEKRLGISSS